MNIDKAQGVKSAVPSVTCSSVFYFLAQVIMQHQENSPPTNGEVKNMPLPANLAWWGIKIGNDGEKLNIESRIYTV